MSEWRLIQTFYGRYRRHSLRTAIKMLVLPCAGRRPAGLGSTGALGDEWYVYIGRSANVMCTEELHKPAAK